MIYAHDQRRRQGPTATAAGTSERTRSVPPSPLAISLRHVLRRPDPNPQPEPFPAGERSSVAEVLRSPGKPLEPAIRGQMEARLGEDFSDVRVHTGPLAQCSAARIGARAYASGSQIVIGDPSCDRHTLAHELTHVVQQRSGPVGGAVMAEGLTLSNAADPFERDAETIATRALREPPGPPPGPRAAAPAAANFGTTVAASIQRTPMPSTGGHGIAGLVWNKGAAAREEQLSSKYHIRIGPPPDRPHDHFSHSMLDWIDKVLDGLPPEHIRDNPQLTAIQPAAAGSDSAASAYEERAITVVNPFGMPTWMYTLLNRGVGWQRWLMDKGAMADYEGISAAGDRLGIGGQKRRVMGGVSKVLAHGNLVEWTIRHETGHSVDLLADWTTLKAEPRFGGWQTYSPGTLGVVARMILAKEGLEGSLAVQDQRGTPLIEVVTRELDPRVARSEPQRLASLAGNFPNQNEHFKSRLERVVRFAQLALAQPWTLTDGGGDTLTIDGRTYHVDHYGQWVSYLREQRTNYAVSNYQFSTPAEWFAEAYAAFFDPKPEPRARLNPEVRTWFEEMVPLAPVGPQQDQG